MDQMKLARQVVDFQRAAFENTFNALVYMQDQAERMSGTVLTRMPMVPEEGRRAMEEWVSVLKKGREAFKNSVDEVFDKMDNSFLEKEPPTETVAESATE